MKKALFVGINYVEDPAAILKGCVDDVQNMAAVLTTYYGYTPDNITMLYDTSSDPSQAPTKANILAALQALAADSAQCDSIWFHYSGHGTPLTGGSGSAIVPVDYAEAGLITDQDLFAIVQGIQCPAMILMDSCNSGSMCDLEWNYEYLYGLNFMRTQFNSQQIINPNIFMISGSKANQASAEILDTTTNEYEGAFTDAVLNVLRENSYTISLGKLMQAVCVWLVNRGISGQKPILSSSSASPMWSIAPVSSSATVIQNNFQGMVGGGP